MKIPEPNVWPGDWVVVERSEHCYDKSIRTGPHMLLVDTVRWNGEAWGYYAEKEFRQFYDEDILYIKPRS